MADPIATHEREKSWTVTALAVWARRRWVALFCLVVPLAAAVSAAAFLPNRYRSAALVVVDRVSLVGALAAAEGAAPTEAQIQRLHEENLSRSHLQGLIERYRLYPELAGKVSLERIIDQMRRDIRTENREAEHSGGRTLVAFQISFRGRDPRRVAQVTSELAAFYVDASRRQRELESMSTIAMLEAKADQMKVLLDAQGSKVSDFITQHLHELPAQVPLNLATLERLNALLVRDRDLRTRPPAGRSPEPDAEKQQEVAARLAQMTERLNALRTRLTEKHPDLAALKAEIAELEKSGARRATPSAAPSTSRQPAAPAPQQGATPRESQVLKQIATTEQYVHNAPKRERELELLLAPYQATQQMYTTLLARLHDARLAAEQLHSYDPIRVLDDAVVAREPIAPDRLRLLTLGVLCSVLLALGAVLLAEQLDTSFHTVEDVRAFTWVTVLASTPRIVSSRDRARRRGRARWMALLLVLAAGAVGAGTWALVHDNEALVRMLARNA